MQLIQRLQRLFKSKSLLIINVSLVSLLVGSLITSLFYLSCRDDAGRVFAQQKNRRVVEDSEALESAQQTQRAFRNIAETVSPAVVSINAVRVTTQRNPYNKMFDDDLFRFFFGNRPRGQQRRRRAPQQRKTPTLGSGFVINAEGYLVSNHHVVKQAEDIKVIFQDGREFKAEVVGVDPETDIALLKIDPGDKKIPVCTLGNSDGINVGDWSIAIGNPFNLPGTFTVGVVSAKSRGERLNAPYQNFIQTDTAINPGNSGGPLVNIRGEVIGVNTMIYTRTGGSLGIGFAIPVNIAKRVIESLIEDGTYERGYLGIYPEKIDPDMRKALKLDKDVGVLVNKVIEGGPAAKAGLKDGDVILKINDEKITSVAQLMRLVAGLEAGSTAKLKIQRNWKEKEFTITIGKRPGQQTAKSEEDDEDTENVDAWLGMKVVPISKLSARLQQQLRIRSGESGVVIVSAEEAGARAGLEEGDLIKEINYIDIPDIGAYRGFVKKFGDRDTFIFKIRRRGRSYYVAVNK